MKGALDIIKAEHRALAAVLTALQSYVNGIVTGRYEPDFEVLDAMIQYITELPDQVHHPKEDQFLFVALRRRSPEAAAVLDVLEKEHRNIHNAWTALAAALADFRVAGAAGAPAFKVAVDRYFDFQWQHMSKEETQVMPLARKALAADDWAAIDAAFNANDNPWEGPAGKYKALFTRIVSLVPAPIGVGADHRPPNA
ncbi:MAG: hemerythrin domain-containing protein [Burkholderiales bacterium]